MEISAFIKIIMIKQTHIQRYPGNICIRYSGIIKISMVSSGDWDAPEDD